MSLEQRLRAANRRAIALALPEGAVLVEFVRLDLFDFKAVLARQEPRWKPARYLAFVLPASEPDNVGLIDLGDAQEIDQMVADFRARIISEAEEQTDRDMVKRRSEHVVAPNAQSGCRLREIVLDKLLAAIGVRRRLLLAPDSNLTRLPFEVLPRNEGGHLIDTFQISYVSCGRDVLRFGTAIGQAAKPFVAADPDFDLAGATSELVSPVRGRLSREFAASKLSFPRLPGTRLEGERIANLLEVQPCLDADVLETNVTQVRSPRILHLATHGFFLGDEDRDPNDKYRWIASTEWGRLRGLRLENPLLRSGLALTGANTWLHKGLTPPDAEDGLLTAEDVSGMDLSDTELVVLSACNTGLGEVRTGEGVFGLRRAFVLAGAKTLIMSLWKVPDEETRDLMEDFYRRILAGEGRAESLRNAQLAIRAKQPHPFFWGAFICQGDPGPIHLGQTKKSREA